MVTYKEVLAAVAKAKRDRDLVKAANLQSEAVRNKMLDEIERHVREVTAAYEQSVTKK